MHPLIRALTVVAVLGRFAAQAGAGESPQAGGAGSGYQVVKVCPLVTAAEVKKFAPWAPHVDAIAKPEEEALGTYGSSCNWPTVFVQVMAFRQGTLDAFRKSGAKEAVSGVGDEAYVRDNRGNYAELVARAGPHLITLQMSIDGGKNFDGTKPSLIGLSKLYVSTCRCISSAPTSTRSD